MQHTKVMVAALVLYDRASFGQSVFDSKEVQIKKCVMAVKKCGGPGKVKEYTLLREYTSKEHTVLKCYACFHGRYEEIVRTCFSRLILTV